MYHLLGRREMMHVLQVVMMVVTFHSVSCAACTYKPLSSSFNQNGQSICNKTNYYIRGIEKDNRFGAEKQVRCCPAPKPWNDMNNIVVYEDWSEQRSKNMWSKCPRGFFLQGMYRSQTGDIGDFSFIEVARCARPALHPPSYGDCQVVDISQCFNSKGKCGCKDGFYINAVHKGQISCCSLAANIRDIRNPEDLKTRVMDTTLNSMAHLANKLGFGYCYGRRGVFVGDDFERSEDTLRASDKQFPTQTQCDANMKCDHRLKLKFGDWRLVAKEVKYGESVTEELQPDTVDSGTTYNKEDNPATESFEVTRDVEETISHTVSDGWAKSHDLDLSIGFNVPMYGGASFGYRFNTNESSSNSNTTSTTKTRTLKKKTTKTLQGHTAAKYRIIVRKVKTTVPYTAIIIAHFSTEFSGFLRHGGGYGSPTTNYHHQHQGSEDSPLFTYTFGGPSTPFYAALQSESESDSQPWLWNEMFQKHPSVRGIIGKLTNEKQYQFTLNGTLKHIGGRNMEVIWETVQMNRR